MLIVITNDDGYDAPGLWVNYDLAHKLAGKNGRVVVVAPKTEQSGVSHAISYLSPLSIEKRREDHFVVNGTPADCVILLQNILDEKPDLLLSGVNLGHNLGPDLLYSGTVGAAIEACAQGIPAIALSQYFKRREDKNADPFASAKSHGLVAVSPIWERFGENWPRGKFCNINFPPCEAEEVAGITLCPAEALSVSNMIARKQTAPNMRDYYWLGHPGPIQARENGKDVNCAQNGQVTVSFCHLNLSDDEFNAENADLFSSAQSVEQ